MKQKFIFLPGYKKPSISAVIRRVAIIITYVRGLITPLITTHEPPSRGPLI